MAYVITEDDKVTEAKNFFLECDYIEPGAQKVHGFSVEKLKILSGGKKFADVAEDLEGSTFIAYLQANDIERFEVDKEYVEKKLSKLKLKISSDIELDITEDAYRDQSRFEIKNNEDGSIHIIIKNIENYAER